MPDVVIGIAVIVGAQAKRIELAESRIAAIGEDSAVGYFVDGMRPSVVKIKPQNRGTYAYCSGKYSIPDNSTLLRSGSWSPSRIVLDWNTGGNSGNPGIKAKLIVSVRPSVGVKFLDTVVTGIIRN